jgi:hypothetical protein
VQPANSALLLHQATCLAFYLPIYHIHLLACIVYGLGSPPLFHLRRHMCVCVRCRIAVAAYCAHWRLFGVCVALFGSSFLCTDLVLHNAHCS